MTIEPNEQNLTNASPERVTSRSRMPQPLSGRRPDPAVPARDRPAGARWARAGLALGCGAVAGLAAGVLQPRGPVTEAEALALIAGGVAVGILTGVVSRTRWSMLAAPAGYLLAFELARTTAGLPSTGPLELDSAFGPLAYVFGRLVPWLLGATALAVGAGWAARDRSRRPIALTALTATLALVAGSLAIPASSPPLTDAGGRPIPGAVSELIAVELGGQRQWIQVRGASADLPVLLYLSGGPGQSDLAFSRVLLEPLTRDFLVVGWDQRGAGKSYPGLDAATHTPRQAVSDTIELARWLTQRYGRQKVYLLGESWGSLLGIMAIQQAPELFHAYVGSGQMVAPLDTDRRIYADLVTQAMGTGNGQLVARLAAMGPPPYRSVFDYATIMSHYGLLEGAYTPPAAYLRRGAASGVGPYGVLGSEYAPIEKINVLRGLLDSFSALYPQLQDVDLRRDATRLKVPVFILAGDHELRGRTDPARQWFDALDAPSKRWYDIEGAGHSVAFEHADELHRILLEDVPPALR